MYIELML